MITNLWQQLEHLSLHSNQSKLKWCSAFESSKYKICTAFATMRTSKPRHLHQAGSKGEPQWGRKKSASALPCCSKGRSAAAWGTHRGDSCLMKTDLLLSHRNMRCFTSHLFVSISVSRLSYAGGQRLWSTTLLEVQHSCPSCQEDSDPALPTAYRPSKTSDFQQKCATAWNFSCGWHKTHKHMPPGFIPNLCHPYSSCKPVSLRPVLNNRALRGADWMHGFSSLWFSREYRS